MGPGAMIAAFLGGGTGAVLRMFVSTWLGSPWGTFCVNVVGSAILAGMLHDNIDLSPNARALLATGLMGGLTTYSTFNHEVFMRLMAGEITGAIGLWTATAAACLCGAWVGWRLVGALA